MSKRASPTLIGAFVVTALTLLFVAVLVLTGGRLFRPMTRVIVYFDDSVAGLHIGSAVTFRGIQIGTVKDLRINMTGVALDPHHVRIPVLLEIDQRRLREQGATAEVREADQVKRLVDLGLRAELATESLVTGVRYVELDIRPDTPARLVHDKKYPEIPSVRSVTEAIPQRVDHILQQLEDADIPGLVHSLHDTVENADQLLRSPHIADALARLDDITVQLEQAVGQLTQATRDLRPALVAMKETVSSVRRTSEQLGRTLDTTLREVSGAARSIRRLSDQISRDPGALVRGGKQ